MDRMFVRVAVLAQILLVTQVTGFDLLIMHTNDFHDRVEEINKYSGSCNPQDSADGKCFGGASRIKSKVDELRSNYNNSILLDGGDQYQGTLWYYKFGGQILSHFMNVIGYDAIGLGNHEFDNGVSGLVPFVDNATFAVLSCNIDLSETPELQGKIHKSKKFTIGGETVGVIGYTTKSTPYISKPETIKFLDELEEVQAEADKLISEGINKIIALGHQGFTGDQNMAQNLRGVDVIVGGHSNTFLYTGEAPSNDDAVGTYPFVVKTSASGEDVLIVQDYAYGKYLGRLHLTFDAVGKITHYEGNPVLLDNTVPKDPEVEGTVQSLLPQIEALKTELVGSTHVHLDGDRFVCRVEECNLGNLICDGMLQQNLRHSDSLYWSDVGIAVLNSGSIRSSLEIGPITTGDLIRVQPFRNTVDIVELRGETVLKMLEFSATRWTKEPGELFGGFLQFSGMRVVYDMTRAAGGRVVDVQMRCSKCRIPKFEPLNTTEVYQILMNNFMITGGDGYSMIPEEKIRVHTIGNVDLDILIENVKENSPVIQGLEGRIRFLQDVQSDNLYSKIVAEDKRCVGDSASRVLISPLVLLGFLVVATWSLWMR